MNKERMIMAWLEENAASSCGEDIRCFIVTVNPTFAQLALDSAAKNRPLKKPTLLKYARDMEAGNWGLTGEAIVFDSNIEMRNGQHRCASCIRAKTDFRTLVVVGVDPKSFDRMDQQCKRTGADVFSIKGEMSANHLTACCVLLWKWENSRFQRETAGGNLMPSISELEDILDRHPSIREFRKTYVDRVHGMKCSDSALAVCHYLFSGIEKSAADEFFDGFRTGEGLKPDDPRRALRDRLIRAAVGRRTISVRELLALTIKAWNVWRSGGKVKRLLVWRQSTDEAFPEIEGL